MSKRGGSKVCDTFSKIVERNDIEINNFVACKKCTFMKSTLNMVKHKCYIMANARGRSVQCSH